MQIYIAHSSDFDFKNKIYEPFRTSSLNTEHEILLPHEGEVEEITRDMIRGADVLVAEVSRPSLGTGIEMGWADAFGVPVIAMSEKGAHVSFSVDNVVTQRFEYENSEEMIAKLGEILKTI
ncbi:MAG: nucleoside 2-deoxyribosyltransferase [Patescibacteria group bacterium]